MKIIVILAKILDRAVSTLSTLLVIIFLLYGVYSLWNTHMIMADAFVDEKLSEYKPTSVIEKNKNTDKNVTDTEENIETTQEKKERQSNDNLLAINKDYKSWLTIFNTNIDYPIVQGKDNMEYVNKNFYGEYSLSGIPFLDYRNSDYFQDNYNLLYGHHMRNGAMFSDVIKFLNQDYFDKHLMGELYSLDKEYDIYLFASLEVYESDRFVYMPGNLNENQMNELLKYIKSNAAVYKNIEVDNTSKLIAFSTCSSYHSNERTVLFGKLVER